jgi:iron complex transport system ATP-binding protein
MIRADGLHLRLNGRGILNGVSLTAHAGEVTVILGPNGSGKTTLMLCLSGQLQPDRGAITLAEQNLADLRRRSLARLLATVPQEHHPVFPYAVREVILLGRVARVGYWSQPGTEDLAMVEEVLDLLSLRPLADKPYTHISGGERQLVLIGRALAQEPQILLLDEPTSHLDFKNQVLILKLIRELAQDRGLTVLLTLHDPNLALLFADRVALLGDGRVADQGPAAEVMQPEAMAALYGIPVEMLAQGDKRLLYPKLT